MEDLKTNNGSARPLRATLIILATGIALMLLAGALALWGNSRAKACAPAPQCHEDPTHY